MQDDASCNEITGHAATYRVDRVAEGGSLPAFLLQLRGFRMFET
jgi:hypothetical protein